MPDEDAIERRLAAVERALTDGHDPDDLAALRDGAALADRVEDLEAATAELERRADDLDAAVQALRGYVGNVRHVNRRVERRADAALAAATDGEGGDGFRRSVDPERDHLDRPADADSPSGPDAPLDPD